MKRIYTVILSIGLCAVIAGCSNDDENNKRKGDPVKLKLTASTKTIEPFQRIKLTLDMEAEDIRATYDSIVWIANGLAHSSFQNPWYQEEDDLKDKSITDYKIGKHKAYVFGYKNSKLLSKDSIEYEVIKPTADFLSVRWSGYENKKNEYLYYKTGLTPLMFPVTGGIGGIVLSLIHINEPSKYEHAILEYMPWAAYSNKYPAIDETREEERARQKIEIEATRVLYHDYITSIYGKSMFLYEGDVRDTNLLGEYNKRFKNGMKAEQYPVEIWVTPTTNICLYSLYTGWYYVIAEPRL